MAVLVQIMVLNSLPVQIQLIFLMRVLLLMELIRITESILRLDLVMLLLVTEEFFQGLLLLARRITGSVFQTPLLIYWCREPILMLRGEMGCRFQVLGQRT